MNWNDPTPAKSTPHPRARTHKVNALIAVACIIGVAAFLWPGAALIVALVIAIVASLAVMAWDIHKAGIVRRLEE